jgi:tetratricopeptide (TPR) repeat protein
MARLPNKRVLARFGLITAAILSFSACAQAPFRVAGEGDRVGVSAALPSIPDGTLNEDILYRFMLAEIAGQRGQLDVATENYLDLARETRDHRLAKRAAEVALFSRRLSDARQAAEIWLELDPESSKARQILAGLMVGAGELEAAKPHLKVLIETDGSVANGLLHLNGLLSSQKDKQQVYRLVRELTAPYPGMPEAAYANALAAWNAGKYPQAMEDVKEALRLRPGWEPAALLSGQMLHREGADSAAQFWRDFLKENPGAREVRLSLARLLTRANRYDEAKAEFQRLTQDFPGNPDVTMALGLLAMQTNDLAGAENYLEQSLEEGFRDPESVRVYLGQINEAQGRDEAAADWYLSVPPGEHFLDAQSRYAQLLARQGRLEEARAGLRALAEKNDDYRVQAIQLEAQLLRDRKAFTEVFEVLSAGLQSIPDAPDLLYDRAMAAERLSKLDVMEQDLRRLISIKPDHAHAYNALGYTLADRTQRLTEAIQLLEQALKLAPDDPFILDSMGWAQYRAGRNEQALDYLRKAYSGRPDPEIAAHLGEVMWVMGNKDEARSVWQSSLRDHPKSEALIEVISRFKP